MCQHCEVRNYVVGVEPKRVAPYSDVAMAGLLALDLEGYLHNMIGQTVQTRLYEAACKGGIVFW